MRLRKLRWLCRRGMKELDVLLEDFLQRNSTGLQDGDWPELENLLALEDDALWDSLLNSTDRADTRFLPLLASISRGAAQPD